MVVSERFVTGHRYSTITTATVTGDTVHELSNVELATKLHYLKVVYYFKASETVNGLSTKVLKVPMFLMLDEFRQAAGRIRKNEGGRAHIKCNDSGVRIVEASCDVSVEEWMEMKSAGEWERDAEMVPDKLVGPDLSFSPLLFVQFTKFKCGGLAVGVSWAHILGDAVTASTCINNWGRLLSGKEIPKNNTANTKKLSPVITDNVLSLKQVETDGDIWYPKLTKRMVTSTFKIPPTKFLNHVPPFEAISAGIWHCVAKIRAENAPKVVTVIRNQIISTVAVTDINLDMSKLATLISNANNDERNAIEGMEAKDYILYGGNLTFVDMESVDFYGFDLKGQKPIRMEFGIDGVGEEGAVLVLPERYNENDGAKDCGKHVVVILPENEMQELKEVLGCEWGIV